MAQCKSDLGIAEPNGIPPESLVSRLEAFTGHSTQLPVLRSRYLYFFVFRRTFVPCRVGLGPPLRFPRTWRPPGYNASFDPPREVELDRPFRARQGPRTPVIIALNGCFSALFFPQRLSPTPRLGTRREDKLAWSLVPDETPFFASWPARSTFQRLRLLPGQPFSPSTLLHRLAPALRAEAKTLAIAFPLFEPMRVAEPWCGERSWGRTGGLGIRRRERAAP